MAKERYTPEQVIVALRKWRGLQFLAAKQLGCSQRTIENYCQPYSSVREACYQARGEIVDEAEMRLCHAIEAQEPWAIAFCLRTLGKDRGYIPQTDMTRQESRDITFTVNVVHYGTLDSTNPQETHDTQGITARSPARDLAVPLLPAYLPDAALHRPGARRQENGDGLA